MNKKTLGIILSYLLIVIDIVVGILFVPFLLRSLGDQEYGLYKLMLSTASYLSVLDFGIGGTITRYVIKFRTEKDRKREENFLAMGFLIYAILALLVMALAASISLLIPKMYAVSIPASQFRYAQTIFLLICGHTALALFNHAFNGLLLAYEKYSYQKITNIVKLVLRILLLVVLISSVQSAMIIAVVDLLLSAALLVVNYLYCKTRLKTKIKLHRWDWSLAKESGVFTLAILMQSIINQFNSNVDNIVLGIYVSAAIVAMYSLALQLFNMYSSLSTAVSSIYLPSISKAVFSGESDDQITERIIKPSRIQLTVLLLALTGFFLLGRDFITVWVGTEYMQVYLLACVLLTTATIELSQNTITAILKAKNKLHGKTLILAGSTLVNVILTVLLVPRLGALGAVLGTAFSLVFGYGVALNFYYHFHIHVNMKTYYKKTYRGILPAAILACLVGIPVSLFLPLGGWFGFALKAAIYIVIYVLAIYLIGFNKDEKQACHKLLRKFTKRKGKNHEAV